MQPGSPCGTSFRALHYASSLLRFPLVPRFNPRSLYASFRSLHSVRGGFVVNVPPARKALQDRGADPPGATFVAASAFTVPGPSFVSARREHATLFAWLVSLRTGNLANASRLSATALRAPCRVDGMPDSAPCDRTEKLASLCPVRTVRLRRRIWHSVKSPSTRQRAGLRTAHPFGRLVPRTTYGTLRRADAGC